MALTNEDLDTMQEKLLKSFNGTSGGGSYESRIALGTMATAIINIENEKRTRAEYKPHTTLQKD